MRKIFRYFIITITIILIIYIIVKYFNLKLFKTILIFFNTGIGTAIIGFLGVIVGSIISYIFNKNYQNKLLKNNILEKTLSKLLDLSIISLKQSSNVYVKRNYISNNISYFKNKTEHLVKDKMQLDLAFKEYDNTYREFEEQLANLIIHFETHQVILNGFINYYQKFMLLSIELVTITNDIKKLYNDKIYISLHKINLSQKYLKSLSELENRAYLIIQEMQYHLQNLTSDIQNMSYSKMFNGINVERDVDNKYEEIKIVKNKKKTINFSKFN